MSVLGKGLLLVILIACLAAIVLRRTGASAVVDDGLAADQLDLQLLAKARKAGADLSKPAEVSYYLYFPDSASAARAAGAIRTADWETEVLSGRGRTEWACLATRTMLLNSSLVEETSKRFASVTASLGGHNQRWEITPRS